LEKTVENETMEHGRGGGLPSIGGLSAPSPNPDRFSKNMAAQKPSEKKSGKKLSPDAALLEAMGGACEKEEDAKALTPGQIALRQIFRAGSLWKSAQTGEFDNAMLKAEKAIAELEREWAAGEMPASRQELLVRRSIEGSQGARWRKGTEEMLRQLALKIATSPQSALAWPRKGFWATTAPVPSERAWTKPVGDPTAKKPAAKPWMGDIALMTKYEAKAADSLLSRAMDAEARTERIEKAGGDKDQSTYNPFAKILLSSLNATQALGEDPVRALFSASQPEHRFSQSEHANLFLASLERWKASGLASPSKSNASPMLLLVIEALGVCQNQAAAKKWVDLIEEGPQKHPWLAFDHQAAVWRGGHPLWALANSVGYGNNNESVGLERAARAIVKMGYGADGSFPEGRSPLMGDEASSFAAGAPNALWAFVLAESVSTRLPELFLACSTANWREKRDIVGRDEKLSLLADLNRRAKNGAAKPQCERAFDLLLSWGADPLDALPPPILDDACEGLIRSRVGARLEQQEIARSLSEADLREALELLREKRAKEAAEAQAKKAAEGEAGAPARVGRRL
jgi:hypothetical protein